MTHTTVKNNKLKSKS